MSDVLLLIDIQNDYFPGGRMELAGACATRELSFAGRSVAAADVQTAYLAALGAVFAQVAPAAQLELP